MNRAFTLIEVIISIFIILVGILGVFFATQSIISYITLSNSKLTASYLAQEGIELVRNMRDNNWLEVGSPSWDTGLTNCSAGCEIDYNDSNFTAYSGNFLKIESVSGLYGYEAGAQTKFKRKIEIIPVDNVPADGINDILEITVSIEWSERGGNYSIEAKEKLYNWRD
jgi:prepilin-type N-terminal cleavage/methylation domain-containing protein